MNRLERNDQTLIIAFATLMVFPVLFTLRHFDDNTLTSWSWIFPQKGMLKIFSLIALGIAPAFIFSKIPFPERRLLLFLFSFAFLAVLPLWTAPETVLDAGRYLLQAKHLELHGVTHFLKEWGGAVGAWTDLPVVPFFYGLLFRCFGESRIFIQLFTTILFSFAVVITFLIGRTLWDRETGFLAGLLLLASPYLLIQVPLMLVDVPVLFLFTLAVYMFLTALELGGAARMLTAVLSIALAVLSKYSVWPMLLVLPVITLVSLVRGNGNALKRSFLILAASAVLIMIFFLAKQDLVLTQIGLLGSYQWPGLERWKENFLSTFFFQVHPFVAAAAAFGACFALLRRDSRFLIPAWFVLFILLFRADRIRYILPLLPLLALMAGYGLNALFADAKIGRFAAFCAVTTTLAVALGGYLPFLNNTSMANLRDAGNYLDSLPGETAAVSVLPQKRSQGNTEMAIPLLDLYTRKRIVYARSVMIRPADPIIATSPLRFTWDVALPAFYDAPGASPAYSEIVISSDAAMNPPLVAGAVSHTFFADTGTFRYRTFVTVLSEPRLAESAQ